MIIYDQLTVIKNTLQLMDGATSNIESKDSKSGIRFQKINSRSRAVSVLVAFKH